MCNGVVPKKSPRHTAMLGAVFAKTRLSHWALTLVAAVLAASCGDQGEDPTQPETTGTVLLKFVHQAGNALISKGFRNGPWPYMNAAGNSFNVERLRYYVSSFVVEGPGGEKTYDRVHFVDFEDPSTWEVKLTDLPPGHYQSIGFTFGLDDTHNVPLDQVRYAGADPMSWPPTMGGGYHYMQLEGWFLDASGVSTAFHTHTGRLVDGSGTHPHDFPVVVVPHFDSQAGQQTSVEIIMDVNHWYDDPLIDLQDHTSNIMGNTVEQDRVQANGVNVFRVGSVEVDDHGRP